MRTTIQIIQMGIPIARCELLDRYAVQAVNRHDKLSLTEAPMLLMEFHGSDAGVAEQAEMVQEIASEHGGEGFEWATTPEERKKLWTARHRAYFAGLQMKPGCRTVTTDTCVPISRLAESVTKASEEAEAAGMQHYIVGHVGDGNFHIAYLVDPTKPEERELAEQLNEKVVSARSRSRAHAAASTASACTRWASCRGSRRRRDRHDAHAEARARPEEHHEPGQDLRALARSARPDGAGPSLSEGREPIRGREQSCPGSAGDAVSGGGVLRSGDRPMRR